VVDIPSVPQSRTVMEIEEPVAALARLQRLAVCGLVEQADQLAPLIETNLVVVRFPAIPKRIAPDSCNSLFHNRFFGPSQPNRLIAERRYVRYPDDGALRARLLIKRHIERQSHALLIVSFRPKPCGIDFE